MDTIHKLCFQVAGQTLWYNGMFINVPTLHQYCSDQAKKRFSTEEGLANLQQVKDLLINKGLSSIEAIATLKGWQKEYTEMKKTATKVVRLTPNKRNAVGFTPAYPVSAYFEIEKRINKGHFVIES